MSINTRFVEKMIEEKCKGPGEPFSGETFEQAWIEPIVNGLKINAKKI